MERHDQRAIFQAQFHATCCKLSHNVSFHRQSSDMCFLPALLPGNQLFATAISVEAKAKTRSLEKESLILSTWNEMRVRLGKWSV